jgi:polyisoprenoid-binding protein YceI
MKKTNWKADPTHSVLGFKIRHLMISNVSGSFQTFQVNVTSDGDDFTTAVVHATADVDSISTNNEKRDAHLRTSDFFHAEKFPGLEFRSTKIEKSDSDTFLVNGDLTLKGVSRPVKLTAQFNGITNDPWGGVRAGFEVTGKINRSDWGINFNAALETGGVMLGEDVKIVCEIEFVKQLEPVAA